MKITCFIDNLSAGGAQRQIVILATLLQKAGHEVTILTYYPHGFFLDEVVNSGVNYLCINEPRPLLRVYKIRKKLNSLKQDVVIAFLKTPVLLAELSSPFSRKWKLIISERNANPETDKKLFWRRVLHLFSDYVVTNSNTNLKLVNKNAPWIKNIKTIYNCVDLNYYIPRDRVMVSKKIYILGVGKYANQKNIINLVESISLLLKNNPLLMIQVDWYGDVPVKKKNNASYYDIVRNRIIELNLQKYINIHGPEKVLKHYQDSTVLVLPSFFEGVPNVVCEAMSCGLPILISNVGDHGNLVKEGLNGYLFNPYSISDMVNSLFMFCSLSHSDRVKMSKESRKKAEYLFNQQIFLEKYLSVINKIL